MSICIRNSRSPDAATEQLHGQVVEDRFRWLEDLHSSDTRAFIQEEQARHDEYQRLHLKTRASVEERVREYLTYEAVDLPMSDRRGGLFYLKRGSTDEQKAIHHRDGAGSGTLVLSATDMHCDVHTSLAILQISADGRYLVFGLRDGGEDVQEIHIYDVDESRLLEDFLPRGFYRGLVFDREGGGFHYVHEEVEGPYSLRRSVRHHYLGDERINDLEVFRCADGPRIRLLLQPSVDGSCLGYTTVSLEATPTIRLFVHRFPLAKHEAQEILGLSDVIFAAQIDGTRIVALTTLGAARGRIVEFSIDRPELAMWQVIVPESSAELQRFQFWGRRLVVQARLGCQKVVRIYGPAGDLLRESCLPTTGHSVVGEIDGQNGRLFYSYSDIAQPNRIFEVELESAVAVPWWTHPRLTNAPSPTILEETVASSDGVSIPLTLIRCGTQASPAPMVLSAYGGAGACNTPRFSVFVAVLLEMGISCAIAHVRGGGERGPEWHQAARKTAKQTSVDDFVTSAKWLINRNIVDTGHLAIVGQSYGGLLTLCSLVQQPRLFRCAVALGPLADLTRFHLFGVARGFTAELGSPEDPVEFQALLKLSPYHGVSDGVDYPALLIISGDRDKRCDSLHARKMIARMREASPCGRPALLDYSSHRGHKPVLSLSERIRSLTDRITFIVSEIGDHAGGIKS